MLTLADEGCVLSWGGNGASQLGFPHSRDVFVPTRVRVGPWLPSPQQVPLGAAFVGRTVTMLAAGDAHTVLLLGMWPFGLSPSSIDDLSQRIWGVCRRGLWVKCRKPTWRRATPSATWFYATAYNS